MMRGKVQHDSRLTAAIRETIATHDWDKRNGPPPELERFEPFRFSPFEYEPDETGTTPAYTFSDFKHDLSTFLRQ